MHGCVRDLYANDLPELRVATQRLQSESGDRRGPDRLRRFSMPPHTPSPGTAAARSRGGSNQTLLGITWPPALRTFGAWPGAPVKFCEFFHVSFSSPQSGPANCAGMDVPHHSLPSGPGPCASAGAHIRGSPHEDRSQSVCVGLDWARMTFRGKMSP